MSEHLSYVYILRCADGTLYTGWTNHLRERVEAHNRGKGAKYTKPRRPVTLIYYESFLTKQEAMSREYAVKRLSRKEKLLLAEKEGLPEQEFPGASELYIQNEVKNEC